MPQQAGEIDEGKNYIGYREALALIEASIRPAGEETLPLGLCAGRIAAAGLTAQISYPAAAVSLKDGFAVRSADVDSAGRETPVALKVAGAAFAGVSNDLRVAPGAAVRICSGATIPAGVDAVVAGEFCQEAVPGEVFIKADAGTGRNILRAGAEVEAGTTLASSGQRLFPGLLGLAAAAGISQARVYRRPRVALIGIGDEVVAPGDRLLPGQLYASNLVTLEAWLASFGIPCITSVVTDSAAAIRRELHRQLPVVDAILTSGGAWGSERDLVVGTLDQMDWQQLFHYVRMGPGKGTAFGLWENVPVFCLPGGPTSNQMAFLQLALPALFRLGGDSRHPLPSLPARLSEVVTGRHRAWTEFKDAVVTLDASGCYTAALYSNPSRLQAIAFANSLICIPEGLDVLPAGAVVPVQLLGGRPAD